MLNEVKSKADDVNVETDLEYESVQHLVEDAKSLNCDAVVNCTGMGAAKLCNDNQLLGGRGIMLLYDRKSCLRREASASSMHSHEGEYGAMMNDACVMTEDAPWGSDNFPCYLIVRGDTIMVGGSYLEGDLEPNIRPEERERLYRYAHRLGIDTTRCQPKGEWTGFRPYRRTCRLEEEIHYATTDNVRVVHSYGYGGSGWTVYVGAAKEATRILMNEGT
jgi:glycine/D-amino acid oxidase-like deaminating enzyme